MKDWTLIRDILLFVGGISGIAYETLAPQAQERPTLLILFAAMMGLPAFFGSQVKRSEDKDKK